MPAADSYFFYYYQTPTPATALYAGVNVQAPGVTGGLSGTADTAGVRINGQTSMRFNFNPNPEWFQSATNNFMVGVAFQAGTIPLKRESWTSPESFRFGQADLKPLRGGEALPWKLVA